MRNEAIAPVRRHVAADLDHHLVTVAQRERARIAAHAHAIPKEGDSAVEAQQSPPPERLAPDREQRRRASRRGRAATTPVGSRVHDVQHGSAGCACRCAPGRSRRSRSRRARGACAARRPSPARTARASPGAGGTAGPGRWASVPARCWRLSRSSACSRAAAAAASSAPTITVGAARTYTLSGFTPAAPVKVGVPTRGLVHDPPAGRQAAHAVQARPRAAHGRPPHHRAPRSRDDRPPAPAGRPERPHQRHDHVHRAGPVPRRHRRLSADERPGAELPALLVAPRRGDVPAAAAAAAPGERDGRRLPVHAARHAAPAGGAAGLPRLHGDDAERRARAVHARGTARSRTRSSSAAAASTTSIRTCARRARAGARASSVRPRSPARPRRRGTSRSACSCPIAGTWRLFLQCKLDGAVLTAPFTLQVR